MQEEAEMPQSVKEFYLKIDQVVTELSVLQKAFPFLAETKESLRDIRQWAGQVALWSLVKDSPRDGKSTVFEFNDCGAQFRVTVERLNKDEVLPMEVRKKRWRLF